MAGRRARAGAGALFSKRGGKRRLWNSMEFATYELAYAKLVQARTFIPLVRVHSSIVYDGHNSCLEPPFHGNFGRLVLRCIYVSDSERRRAYFSILRDIEYLFSFALIQTQHLVFLTQILNSVTANFFDC